MQGTVADKHMPGKKMSREAIAKIEIGHTAISRYLALALSLFFVGVIFLVPLSQFVVDHGGRKPVSFFQSGDKGIKGTQSFTQIVQNKNNDLLQDLHHLESTLEGDSFLKKFFLPLLQYIFSRFLEQGNNKVIIGNEGWLYYWPGVDFLVGQPFLSPEQLQARVKPRAVWEKKVQPDPVKAIVDLKKQLAARGIELLLVPVPTKSSIHPERLSSRSPVRPLANRSWSQFALLMEENGVHLFDARSVLAEYAEKHGEAFLATDTHWTPGAMQVVAEGVAAYIKALSVVGEETTLLQLHPKHIAGLGDIGKMLILPDTVQRYPEQKVEIRQVTTPQREFWQPYRNAEILLLGDSFTNIYSVNSLGWGAGAGFAEHLSYSLQRPLDLLARNDSGAYISREILAGEMRRGRDRLSSKKLVVWQFADRELSQGNWKLIDLSFAEPSGSTAFHVTPPGAKIAVTGVISEISRSPEPGSGPYRDNILTLHLVDLQVAGKALEKGQALVYGWGMRDNQLTEMSALRAGDTISLSLVSWQEVEGEYGSYRRSSLDDEMIELESPNWGELTNE